MNLDYLHHHHHPPAAYTGLGVIREDGRRIVAPKHEHSPTHQEDVNQNLPPSKRARINYECEACGTTYTEKRALARHRHTDMHRRRLGLQPDKRHTCVKCGRSFGRNHDLQRHRREQHGEATGATAIDVSSCATAIEVSSCASDISGLSPDHYSARSTSGASWCSSANTAATLPDDLAPTLRGAKSVGDFPHDSAHSSVKTEPADSSSFDSSSSAAAAALSFPSWSGEPFGSDDTRIYTTTDGTTGPARSRSSSSLQASETTAQTDDSPSSHRSLSSRPRLPAKILASQGAAQPRNVEAWQPVVCMVCDHPFAEEDDLIQHLHTHLESFQGRFECQTCQIGFDHDEDLQAHLDAARSGHCGFRFAHSAPCTGHHPPARGEKYGKLYDSDCFRLEYQLRNWEQAQLHAYISDINDLIAERDARIRQRWSVEALIRNHRNSTNTYRSSVAASVNSYASAPCDTTTNGRYDVEGLQKRMKKISLKDVGASVKSLMSGGSGRSPSASSSSSPRKPPKPSSAPHDKTLFQAIHRGNLKKATELLHSGADASCLHRASGTLTAAALWNHTEVQSLTVAHRLTEDIHGSCDVCHRNSGSFSRGNNKVRALLAHGANVAQRGGIAGLPILSAAWLCKPDIVLILLQHGAYVNQRDERFGSPVGVAAGQAGYVGSVEVVETLLHACADVRIRGAEGSPLEVVRRRREFWRGSRDFMPISEEMVRERVERCEAMMKLLEDAERG